MPAMTPHTFSLSKVDGSQEFFDAIDAVKQTDDPTEVQELYNYLINYDLGNVIDIPLTYYKDLILYNTDKIAGYEFSGVPDFFDVSGLQPVAYNKLAFDESKTQGRWKVYIGRLP